MAKDSCASRGQKKKSNPEPAAFVDNGRSQCRCRTARQPPTSVYSASDPWRLVSSDVALCPTGKDNDGFNEGPLNHVTVDLANNKKKNGHADGPAVRHANTKLCAAASVLIFTFNESGTQVRVRCYGLQPPQESKLSPRNLKSLYKAWVRHVTSQTRELASLLVARCRTGGSLLEFG